MELKKETSPDPLNEYLDKLVDDGMSKTKEWVTIWKEALMYFFGDQLKNKRKHKNWEWVILNYIWPSAIQEIAKLTKNDPKIIVDPLEASDADYAETWQALLQYLWKKGLSKVGMRREHVAAILDSKIFGYRVCKVFWEDKCYWDDNTKQWMGDVKYRLWHPAEFWASDTEKVDDGACGTQRYVPLEWAVSRWPQYKKELEGEASKYHEERGMSGETVRGQLGTAGTYPSDGKGGKDTCLDLSTNRLSSLIMKSDRMAANTKGDIKYVKLEEIFFYDYEEVSQKIEEEVPVEEMLATGQAVYNSGLYLDAQGEPIDREQWPKRVVKQWKQPKYPNGRYILRAGHTILNPSQEEQAYPHTKWPFIVVPHYLLPHMWQGSNAVTMYRDTQDMINVTASHLTNNMKLYGDPKIAVENGAIATKPGRHAEHYKIGAGAGAIIRLVKGGLSRFKIIDPPAPSAAALQLYGLFAQEFKNIVGLQDVALGKQTEGSATATEMQHLAMSAYDRIALQSIYEDEWVKGIANLTAEICQTYYDPGRIIRIVGENGAIGVAEITQKLKDVKFDIDIIRGTTLPFDEEKRIMKYEKAYMIMQNPQPNPMLEEMLKVLDIPNWRKILGKFEAYQQYVMFIQLYEAVKAGQITPQQAVQALVQKAMEVYSQSQTTMAGQAEQNQKQMEAEKEASKNNNR